VYNFDFFYRTVFLVLFSLVVLYTYSYQSHILPLSILDTIQCCVPNAGGPGGIDGEPCMYGYYSQNELQEAMKTLVRQHNLYTESITLKREIHSRGLGAKIYDLVAEEKIINTQMEIRQRIACISYWLGHDPAQYISSLSRPYLPKS